MGGAYGGGVAVGLATGIGIAAVVARGRRSREIHGRQRGIHRRLGCIGGQVDHLPRIDQVRVPDLAVDGQQIAQRDVVAGRDLPERVAPLHRVLAADGGRRVGIVPLRLAGGHVQHLARVHVPADAGVGVKDRPCAGAAALRDGGERIPTLNHNLIAAAAPAQGCPEGHEAGRQNQRGRRELKASPEIHISSACACLHRRTGGLMVPCARHLSLANSHGLDGCRMRAEPMSTGLALRPGRIPSG